MNKTKDENESLDKALELLMLHDLSRVLDGKDSMETTLKTFFEALTKYRDELDDPDAVHSKYVLLLLGEAYWFMSRISENLVDLGAKHNKLAERYWELEQRFFAHKLEHKEEVENE